MSCNVWQKETFWSLSVIVASCGQQLANQHGETGPSQALQNQNTTTVTTGATMTRIPPQSVYQRDITTLSGSKSHFTRLTLSHLCEILIPWITAAQPSGDEDFISRSVSHHRTDRSKLWPMGQIWCTGIIILGMVNQLTVPPHSHLSLHRSIYRASPLPWEIRAQSLLGWYAVEAAPSCKALQWSDMKKGGCGVEW